MRKSKWCLTLIRQISVVVQLYKLIYKLFSHNKSPTFCNIVFVQHLDWSLQAQLYPHCVSQKYCNFQNSRDVRRAHFHAD